MPPDMPPDRFLRVEALSKRYVPGRWGTCPEAEGAASPAAGPRCKGARGGGTPGGGRRSRQSAPRSITSTSRAVHAGAPGLWLISRKDVPSSSRSRRKSAVDWPPESCPGAERLVGHDQRGTAGQRLCDRPRAAAHRRSTGAGRRGAHGYPPARAPGRPSPAARPPRQVARRPCARNTSATWSRLAAPGSMRAKDPEARAAPRSASEAPSPSRKQFAARQTDGTARR